MKRDIIVIGTSAGGVEALTKLVPEFRPRFPAAVFVVCHIPAEGSRGLANLLGLHARVPVSFATDSVTVEPGTLKVAPPDCHLLLQDGHVVLTRGPKQNRARPAIDPLFRSAALAYGPRVIGVVLTGLLDDGSAGLLEVKRRGGLAIIQDPSDAQFPDMPRNALSVTKADYCVPLRDVAPLLARLCTEEVPEATRLAPGVSELEARGDTGELVPMDRLGKPSAYSCPECSGVLWEVNDPALLRFRCRVGHAFSVEGLVSEHHKVSEDALWAAARSLEESASFARRLSDRCRTSDLQDAAAQYQLRAENDAAHAASIVAMLTRRTDDRAPSDER